MIVQATMRGTGDKGRRRLAASAGPAAVVTAAMFLFMNGLITVDRLVLEARPVVDLAPITPRDPTPDEARPRDPPQRIETADQPPAPPPLHASRSEIDLPAPRLTAVAPSRIGFVRFDLPINQPPISNRNAQPVRPPAPTYPRRALERGLEGGCDVALSIDARGRPFDIRAACTDPVFTRAAETAVARSEFAPMIRLGQAVEQTGVVYPITFKLTE